MIQDSFFSGQGAVRVNWASVHCIRVFKLDLLTTDEIRLSFDLDEPPHAFIVSEEQPGFEEFKCFVEKRFAFPKDWWSNAVSPAFARNETVLFRRTPQA